MKTIATEDVAGAIHTKHAYNVEIHGRASEHIGKYYTLLA